MKDIFKFVIVLFSILSLNTLNAQQYVRAKKDFNDGTKPIRIFEGEIYILSKQEKDWKYFQVNGQDYKAKDDVELINDNPQNLESNKNEFVKIKDDGLLYIDVSPITTNQDIWLADNIEKKVQFSTKKTASINSIGENFRLIIPNTVTIWYNKNELTKHVEPLQDKILDINDNQSDTMDEPQKMSLVWWQIVLCIAGLGIVGFIIWWFFFRKKEEKEPIRIKYQGNNKSLSNFANENNIKLKDLLKWNKIDKKYQFYNEQEKNKIQNQYKGKSLIVGFQAKKTETNDTTFFLQSTNDEINEKFDSKEKNNDTSTPNNTQQNNDISTQLTQMQNVLLKEIKQLKTEDNNSGEINKLNKEVSDLKSENVRLNETMITNNSTISELKTEKLNLTSQIQELNSENKRLFSKIEETEKKVIVVDYLKGYADSVYSYLEFCQKVSNEAYSAYNRINQQQQAFGAGLLLMNFQSAVNSISVGSWLQIVQDIKETGTTTNKNLIRSLAQPQNNNEKQKEFQRLLFTEVLVKYSSNILTLAEAFKNLPRFQVISELVFDIQNTFSKYVPEIVNKAKTVGMEIKYVPLFKNFGDYLEQIETIDKERSTAYKDIKELQKDDIVEIVSYGVKTIFEDSRTYIILS
jgi:hypothetical protein